MTNKKTFKKQISKIIFLFVFFLLFISLLPNKIQADLTISIIDVSLTYDKEKIPDNEFRAAALICSEKEVQPNPEQYRKEEIISQLKIKEYDSKANCYWQPTQTTTCKKSECSFPFLGTSPWQTKLAIYIPSLDKVFITNTLSTAFDSHRYKVKLFSDKPLQVTENPLFKITQNKSISYPFAVGLTITLLLEMITALLFAIIIKISKKIIISVLIANLISFPIVCFVFPSLSSSYIVSAFTAFLLSEIFAIVFEASFIYHTNKKRISFKKSFLLSILINLVSLFIGYFILASILGLYPGFFATLFFFNL